MDLSNVTVSEITFKKLVKAREDSAIFIVEVRGLTCVMKVVCTDSPVIDDLYRLTQPLKFHDEGPIPWAPPDREIDPYTCESTAYKRLKEQGLCDRGIVPQFYGTLEKLDVQQFRPHLDMFLEDEYVPNAIFLEYIPNIRMIFPHHYTRERAENFIHGIQEIHQAMILHLDIEPQNMMIIEDDPARAIWLDFDRAQTYCVDQLDESTRYFLDNEEDIVREIVERIVSYFVK